MTGVQVTGALVTFLWAVGAAGAHLVYAEGVVGSNPTPPIYYENVVEKWKGGGSPDITSFVGTNSHVSLMRALRAP